MASTTPPTYGQATLFEKLDLVPAISQVLATAVFAGLTGPFRGSESAAIRLTIAQLQYIFPPWIKTYEAFCSSKSIAPNIATLPSGIQGFWLGSPTAKNVLIYYHGGGYVMPGQPDYLKYLQGILDSVTATDKDLSIFMPAYTLAPQAIFAAQLAQGVDTLRYVIEKTNHSSSNILLSGDSAGGNMAPAVLSHISHPHSSVPALELSEPLKGVLLISPWTSSSLDYPSVKFNKYKDVIPEEAASYWMNAYKGGASVPVDPYLEAATAPESWWDGAKTRDMIVLAGQEEILLDAIEESVNKYKIHNKDVTYVVGKGEGHDGAIFMGPCSDTGMAIDAWLKARL